MVVWSEVEEKVLEQIADRSNREMPALRAAVAARPHISLKDLGITLDRVRGLINYLSAIALDYESGIVVPSRSVTQDMTVNDCIALTYRCAKGEGS